MLSAGFVQPRLALAPEISIALQAGFSLQRPPLGALSRKAPVRPCGGRFRSKPSCFSGAPLRYAPSSTRLEAKPTGWWGTRSLRSLVCLRAPSIAPARPIVAGRAIAPPAYLTSIALQGGTPFRLHKACATRR